MEIGLPLLEKFILRFILKINESEWNLTSELANSLDSTKKK